MIRSTLLAVALFAHLSAAETLLVPEQYPTIYQAVVAASNGDVVEISPGIYEMNFDIDTGSIQVLSVRGNGQGEVILTQPEGTDDSIVDVYGGYTTGIDIKISDITIRDSSTSGNVTAAAIFVDPQEFHRGIVFDNVRIENCQSEGSNSWVARGGFYVDCVFQNCTSANESIVVVGEGFNTWSEDGIIGCDFISCEARYLVDGCYKIQQCTIDNCLIEQHCFRVGGDRKEVSDRTMTNNTYVQQLIFFEDIYTALLSDCDIRGNTYTGSLNPLVSTCLFRGNGTVLNCQFESNSSARGGAIQANETSSASKTLYISNCNFIGNSAILAGGAIYRENTNIVLTNSTGCENSPNDYGEFDDLCESTVACCLGTACIELLQTDCTSNGGEILDAPCSESNCSSEGACCISGTCTVTTVETCFSLGGSFAGNNTDCSTTDCPSSCEGDVSGNGTVDFTDLLILINNWGNCPG